MWKTEIKVFDEITINKSAIERYNKNNKNVLTKRDFCKALFTILLYGGTQNTWKTTFELEDNEYVLSSFIKVFIKELKTNITIIITDDRFKDIVEWKKNDLLEKCKQKISC